MTVNESPPRATTTPRRTGYVVAVLVNVGLLLAVNAWPGWDAVPFLTGETLLVLTVVNASITTNLVANALYAVHDPAWLKSSGDLLALGVGVLALVRVWQVFPFDLGADPLNWALVVRLALVVGIVGSCLGMLVALATFIRSQPKV